MMMVLHNLYNGVQCHLSWQVGIRHIMMSELWTSSTYWLGWLYSIICYQNTVIKYSRSNYVAKTTSLPWEMHLCPAGSVNTHHWQDNTLSEHVVYKVIQHWKTSKYFGVGKISRRPLAVNIEPVKWSFYHVCYCIKTTSSTKCEILHLT